MEEALLSILNEGGPVLWALLGLALLLYGLLASTWDGLRRARVRVLSGRSGQASVAGAVPWQRSGQSRREIEREYAGYELDELAWVSRRLPVLAVMTAAAPLLGLLGTVAGMLITFNGLAGAGGGAAVDTVSVGISKALVTTQAGLVVAIPAAFLLALLRRWTERTQWELQRQLHAELAGGGNGGAA
jgi:biopolymer transport protein ExbB